MKSFLQKAREEKKGSDSGVSVTGSDDEEVGSVTIAEDVSDLASEGLKVSSKQRANQVFIVTPCVVRDAWEVVYSYSVRADNSQIQYDQTINCLNF